MINGMSSESNGLSKRSVLAASVIAAFLSGCGGSSNSTDSGSTGSGVSVPAVNTGVDAGSADSEPLATNPSFSPENIGAALSGQPVYELSISLDGLQTVPSVATRNNGSADFTLNTGTNDLYGSVRSSVTDATEAHIHEGQAGEVGAVVVTLQRSDDSNNQFSVTSGTQLTGEQASRLQSGQLYVDIHSTAHPDGEIRGQLSAEAVQSTAQATLDDIQALVFTPQCSGCHTGGGQTLPSIMNLTTADASYQSLVDVNSISVAELSRVQSGDADQSFLIHKLEGTQSVGSRMPFRGRALDSETIDLIRQWIDNGAQR